MGDGNTPQGPENIHTEINITHLWKGKGLGGLKPDRGTHTEAPKISHPVW